jgi:uncharacterized protein (TIGR03000 family)
MLRYWVRALGLPALVVGTWLMATPPASAGVIGFALAARALTGGYGYGYYGPYGYSNYGPYYGYYGEPYYGYGSGYGSPWGYGYRSYYVPRSQGWGYYSSDYPLPSAYYYDEVPMTREVPMRRGSYTSFYPPQSQTEVPRNAALVAVRVPPDAELWFGGDKTTQTGEHREFVTPELKQDKDYFYTLKARWNQNGEQTEKTRRVRVRPGSRVTIDFFSAPPAQAGERRELRNDQAPAQSGQPAERAQPRNAPAPPAERVEPPNAPKPAPRSQDSVP